MSNVLTFRVVKHCICRASRAFAGLQWAAANAGCGVPDGENPEKHDSILL
jgi:hypothetical protein